MKRQEKGERPENEEGVLSAIQLLDSTHDSEISSACIILYQFTEKSDKNKLFLLTYENCLKTLLSLLEHECLSIRRLSCMVVASMSLHAEVQKHLRRSGCLIQKLVSMVESEGDNILKEYTLLLLSSLANEPSCKVLICNNGGLVPLLDCLKLEDPDIVKNALLTLTLMLQDYHVKVALHSCNDIEMFLAFLMSKHKVIRHLVVCLLIQTAEYCPLRKIMIEKGLVQILGHFLSNPDNKELILLAFDLLSKCLTISTAVDEFCTLGGIEILMNFATKPSNEVEEEKRKPTKKDSKSLPSKMKAMKDVGEQAHQEHEINRNLTPAREMKECIFECLQWIAMQLRHYRRLQRHDIDDLLLTWFPTIKTSEKSLTTFLNLLAILCKYVKSRLYFGEKEEFLATIISVGSLSENQKLLKALSFCLANLSFDYQKNCRSLVDLGVIHVVVSLLKCLDEEILLNSCSLVCNLSSCPESRTELIRHNAVFFISKILGGQLTSEESRTRDLIASTSQEDLILGTTFTESHALIESCLSALTCLAVDDDARKEFLKTEILELIVGLLTWEHPKVQRMASRFIAKLAVDAEIANNICNIGGLEILYDVNNSRSRRNEFSELALNQLYKSRLVEKFAFKGILSYEDVTQDGFYDVGQIQTASSFRSLGSLKDYYSIQQNKRFRPIFVVNPKPPRQPPGSKEPVAKESLNATSTDIKIQSGTGASKYKAKKNKKLKEVPGKPSIGDFDVTPEQDLQMTETPDVPEDPDLFEMIENCQATICHLPTIKHQIIALARFVSEKMGGQVFKDYLHEFEWENHLNQLREQLKNDVIPIGIVKFGIHYHRAFLFKILADKMGIRCCLKRREYNRGFIEVVLMTEEEMCLENSSQKVEQLVPRRYVVDVIFQPGRLIPVDSLDAQTYSMF